MAWTAPRTYVSGEIVTAAILNTDVRDNLLALSQHLYTAGVRKGADIASATALTLGTDGDYFHVTGTTTITSISTQVAGSVIFLQFDGAVLLTYNATTLILRGNINVTTAAGDIFIFVSEGSGNWREVGRLIRALGTPSTQASADAPAAGTGSQWANIDHKHGMPTITAGALTRAAGNTTEATTTSLSSVDLMTHTVSVAVGVPVILVYVFRKSAGAANDASLGLKLNATQVAANVATMFTATNQAENGLAWGKFIYGVTSYLAAGAVEYRNVSVGATSNINRNFGTNMPTATLTSIIITGLVADAAITLAVDESHVYTYAVS